MRNGIFHQIAPIAIGILIAGSLPQSSDAQPVRQMLNGFRAEQGLGPLAPSGQLEEAAKAHALDMASRGFFDHQGSSGSNVLQRARAAGYAACTIAENIAKGQQSVHEVLGDWVQSPGHRNNILNPDVVDYGLVRAPGDIWVLVLGKDGC
ncbi:CAP domain-containing protein [Sagittula sp. NFXS13]|uniref:CAP domain-containing protein n=1 Tax=Sagittula sp. NFXS13 TaxID=2819095 RepID=UPI0032DE3096